MEALRSFGVVDRALTSKEQWMTFWTLFLCCTVNMYNSLRVTPALVQIGEAYGVGVADAAYLTSAFAVAGLLLAFPGALVMRSMGAKSAVLAACSISVAGTLLGMGTDSFQVLLASRVLEGVAFGVAGVVVPTLLPMLFPKDKMGLVSGIWSIWTVPGLVFGFVTTPVLLEAFGPLSSWPVALALQLAVMALILVGVKIPAPESASEGSGEGERQPEVRSRMKSACAVALSFFCWGIAYGTVNVFYPTYLQEVKGFGVLASSMVPMLLAAITAPLGILFGVVAGKTSTRKWFIVVPYVVVAIMYATFGFAEDAGRIMPWVFACVFGACAAAVPMATYALVPILARDPAKTAVAMALLTAGLQLSNIVVGFFGALIQDLGYHHMALCVVAPIALVGACIGLLATGDKKASLEECKGKPASTQ